MTRKEILRARLKDYLQAEHDVILHGQTVSVEGMRITRANLDSLRKEIANIRSELEELDANKPDKRSRIRVVVPI